MEEKGGVNEGGKRENELGREKKRFFFFLLLKNPPEDGTSK